MSANFARTLVWKHDYDVKLWRHKQRTPKTNDTICRWMNPPWKFSAYATDITQFQSLEAFSFPVITLSNIFFLSTASIIFRATVKSLQYSVHPACLLTPVRRDLYWICSSDNVVPEPSLSVWKKDRFCLAFFDFQKKSKVFKKIQTFKTDFKKAKLATLTARPQKAFVCIDSNLHAWADPASKVRGAISVIFGGQISYRLCYCKKDEVCFTTLEWQSNGRQYGLVSRMLLSELYKIVVNKVTFVGFRGADRPSPGSAPACMFEVNKQFEISKTLFWSRFLP